MLSGHHFYHQLTRRFVILFGNVFNNITILRTDDEDEELKRFKVPVNYGPKEKYITRLQQDPTLNKEVAISLPRLSFEITSIEYDESRKQNSLLRVAKGDTASQVAAQYMGVPYDLKFQLVLYARNVDDGTHIVEQILPYFNPDLTIPISPIDSMGFLKDIPIILDSVTQDIEYEGGFDSTRFVYWTLNFTMKVHYYGPIRSPKLIRKVITNIFNDPSLRAGYIVRVNCANTGNGNFHTNDIVFQGAAYERATAYGIVRDWNSDNLKLDMGGAQGTFKIGETIRAVSSNAVYTIESFDAEALKLATITIEPDPIDADPEDDFGYTTTITEYY